MAQVPTRPPTTLELQEAIENLQAQLEQVTEEGAATREELTAARRQAQAKIALPKKFEGKREDLNAFLAAMELYHRYNSMTLQLDEDRILSTMMNMAREALAWAEPLMSDWLANSTNRAAMRDGTTEMFGSWRTFRERMKITFREVDAENVAQRKLLRLCQHGAATQYAADFQRISARLGWDDQGTGRGLLQWTQGCSQRAHCERRQTRKLIGNDRPGSQDR